MGRAFWHVGRNLGTGRAGTAGVGRGAVALVVAVLMLAQLALPLSAAIASSPPIANPGADRTLQSGAQVTLDGTGSVNPGGGSLTYDWTQTAGPTVTLVPSGPGNAVMEFYAPLVASATPLTFELTVDNGTASDTASVTITVIPAGLPQRVSLQPGRSGYQDIKADGRNVYIAWCYRNGAGLDIYFTRSTDGGATYEAVQRLTPAGASGVAYLGDGLYPQIAVEGSNVYVAWHQVVQPAGLGTSLGGRIFLAHSNAGGARGTFTAGSVDPDIDDAWYPAVAASTSGGNSNVFVMYQGKDAGGWSLKLASSQDGGQTFDRTVVTANPDWAEDAALVAQGESAYAAYVKGDRVGVYSRNAATAAENAGSYFSPDAYGPRLAISQDGLLCVAWGETVSAGSAPVYASVVPTATLSGSVKTFFAGAGRANSAPDVCTNGSEFYLGYVSAATQPGDWDQLMLARSTSGGAFGTANAIHTLQPGSAAGAYLGRTASIAAAGDLVALGWWDASADRAFTIASRDNGQTFDPAVDQGTWTGASGNVRLAANGADKVPTVHASWMGDLRGSYEDVQVDIYTRPLSSIGVDNLELQGLQVVQAPWDDTPTQRLAQDKKTSFRVDVASGFGHAVTTDVELRYTVTSGGVQNQTIMTQSVELPPYDVEAVYFSGIRLQGGSVAASATVNVGGSPTEVDLTDNSAELSPRAIEQTIKLDGLFVPVVLPGDTGPSTAQFYSAMGDWSTFVAETYPIDDSHWLAETRPTFNWTPDLPGYTPGSKLTDEQYSSLEAQLFKLATLSGHDVALGVVRKGWFKSVAPADYAGSVGLAPFGGKLHAAMEEVGQPRLVGAHEIAHTYGLIPPGTPGDMMPPRDSHFDGRVATGYSWARGEIAVTDPTKPPVDFMQWNTVPNTWVSPFTYYALMDALKVGAADPAVVLLSGTIDKSGTAELLPAYRFDSEYDLALGNAGALEFVFRDAGDAVLATAGFDPTFTMQASGSSASLSGSAVSDSAPFSLRVPWVPGTAKIELVYEGVPVAAHYDVSANAPTVSVSTPPAGAEYLVGETVTVAWDGADLDGGSLRYTPMLSIDGGASWSPIVNDTTDTSCQFIPTRQFVTESAQIKVLVTDGVNSGEAVSGVFAIRPVVPTGAGGGGVPTWGPVLGYPEPTAGNDPNAIDAETWTLGANGDTVYAGWIQPSNAWDFHQRLRVMRSLDRGQTWGPATDVSGQIELDTNADAFRDMRVFTFQGDTVYALSAERIAGAGRQLLLRKSTDGAATFPTTTVVTTWPYPDPYPAVLNPRMVVDGEDIYVLTVALPSADSSQLWLFKSTDGGATFGGPTVVVSGPRAGVGAIGESPNYCVDGENVYVAYYRGNSNQYGPPDAGFIYSRDGGATFSAPETVIANVYHPSVAADGARVHVSAYYIDSSTSSGVKLASSDDYGATFGAVQAMGGGWSGDSGGRPPNLLARGDKIAVVWRGKTPTPTYPIYSCTSTDGGQTFSAPFDLFSVLPPDTLAYGYNPGVDWPGTKVRAQGDSIYVATQYPVFWKEGDSGQGGSKRLAVFTSTDFGASFLAPEVTTLDPPKEDSREQTVLAVTPGLVYAGAGISTYWTDFGAFIRVGSTGAAPAVAAGPDLSVTEGQIASITADFSADDVGAATATIDWGDGTTTGGAVSGVGTTGTVDAAHAYGTYGTYDATMHLSAGGQSAEDTFTVTVANVPPVLSVPITTAATTAGLAWQPGGITFSDAGWDDVLSATIDWGDGTVEPATLRVTSPGGDGLAQAGAVDAVHTYAAPGAYDVLVTMTDGADETTATFAVEAESNSAPTAGAGGPYVGYEGTAISLDASASVDPDGDALTYSWTLAGEALGSLWFDNRLLMHVFPDDLDTTVDLEVADGRGGTSPASATLTILNVAPTVTAATLDTFTLAPPLSVPTTELATFTDPGVFDTHTALIDWGDGSTSAGIVEESGGSGKVLGAHTYAEPGTYAVTVTVTDKDGGVDAASLDLTVEIIVGPPTAAADTYAATRNKPLVVAAPGLLANDTDPQGDPITVLDNTTPVHGTVSVSSDGSFTYQPKPGFIGTDTFSYRATDDTSPSEPAVVSIVVAPGSVIRVAGANRYATSVEASKRGFPSGALAVVIATGTNWPDALGGSALAGAVNGPLLLTRPDLLPAEVSTEITRLHATKAYILGSTGAVGGAVETALVKKLGRSNVVRLGGSNRYETAQKIADETIKVLGSAYSGDALVATGLNFPDATAAAPLAAALGRPILLANPNTGAVYVPTATQRVTVLGSTAAVPTGIEAALKTRLGAGNVTRLGGADRYATAALIAQAGVDAGMRWDGAGLATGLNFPDALAGGAMLGASHSVLLLTGRDVLNGEAQTRLTTNKASISTLYILGGTAAVSSGVEVSIKTAADL